MKKPCNSCEYALWYSTRKTQSAQPSYKSACKECEKYKQYEQFLESRRKYKQGDLIRSLDVLDHELEKTRFVYMHGKIYHAGWITSLQYRFLRNCVHNNCVYCAVRKE